MYEIIIYNSIKINKRWFCPIVSSGVEVCNPEAEVCDPGAEVCNPGAEVCNPGAGKNKDFMKNSKSNLSLPKCYLSSNVRNNAF